MANSRDRILIVESDPVVSDLIGRQALQPSGFQVMVVNDANSAITKAVQWSPDLIIADMHLPGLSCKDFLVALASQGVRTPVIVLAKRGEEADIMQTFRLGAADYLLMPIREAEVIQAVGRNLQQVNDRRERERLAQQLQQTNQELQSRVRELTTIFAVGKAVTSITDQSVLFEKVLEGALRVTQADLGWFLLRDDKDAPFLLMASQNLPPSMGLRMRHPWDDGISSLVAMSGETLTIHGDPLKRFKISSLGGSALIVPIKIQQQHVMGLLIMMRRAANPFAASEQHLLEALADYTSISLVNARLFRAAEERAASLQKMAETAQMGDKINIDILEGLKSDLTGALRISLAALEKLGKSGADAWRPDQRPLLATLQDQLIGMYRVVNSIAPLPLRTARKERTLTPLGEQVRMSVQRMLAYAQHAGLSLVTQPTLQPVVICVDTSLMAQILDGLLSNAIRFSAHGALITIAAEPEGDRGHVSIISSALTIPPQNLEKLFDQAEKPIASPAGAHSALLGIRPSLVKEILLSENGKIWVEERPTKETVIHFTLPQAR